MLLKEAARKPWVRKVLGPAAPPLPADDEPGNVETQVGKEPDRTTTATEPPRPADDDEWYAILHESSGQRRLRKARRVGIYLLLAVVVLGALRSLTMDGSRTTVVEKSTASSEFPTGEAQAIAARFTRSYMTLPSGEAGDPSQAAEDRLKLLRRDSPADFTDSWNGRGSQTVLSVLPGQVRVASATTATVEVLVQVATGEDTKPEETPEKPKGTPSPSSTPSPSKTPKTSKKAGAAGTAVVVPAAADDEKPAAAEPTPQWFAVSVPVQTTDDRVIVTGTPAFGSFPDAGQMSDSPAPMANERLSRSTERHAEAFFQAWSSGDETSLDAATAPGAQLRPLHGLRFVGLTDWQVHEQDNSPGTSTAKPTTRETDTREAAATVRWQLPGGAQVTQQYEVTLRAVKGGGVTDWRVSEARAHTTNPAESKE